MNYSGIPYVLLIYTDQFSFTMFLASIGAQEMEIFVCLEFSIFFLLQAHIFQHISGTKQIAKKHFEAYFKCQSMCYDTPPEPKVLSFCFIKHNHRKEFSILFLRLLHLTRGSFIVTRSQMMVFVTRFCVVPLLVISIRV